MIETAQNLLVIAAIFSAGWGAHFFFHRREHDSLKSEIENLESELTNAKEGKKVTVKIQNLTPEGIANLALTQEEILVLAFIQREGVFGPPDDISMARAQLAAERLDDKGLIDSDEHGMSVTRLGLEWLDQSDMLE